jgi:hypothetical protein
LPKLYAAHSLLQVFNPHGQSAKGCQSQFKPFKNCKNTHCRRFPRANDPNTIAKPRCADATNAQVCQKHQCVGFVLKLSKIS